METPKEYVDWLRSSAPYFNVNRKKTLVLMLGGEAIEHPNFTNIIHDIALLNSLGLRLVVVHGARPQIDSRLKALGLESKIHNGLRITDESTMLSIKESTGVLKTDIEAALSMGLANSPMHGAQLRVRGGNFVISKPIGIRDGVDYAHTGEVRRIDAPGITSSLEQDAIVLISPLGYSPTGESFNLSAEELATDVAIALKADKLVFMVESAGVVDHAGALVSELNADEAQTLVQQDNTGASHSIKAALRACDGGVQRAHLVSYQENGALLTELYTTDGSGTLISATDYETIRAADIEDVTGIIELIRPLEEAGVLVRRSRELLENEIGCFTVIERDGSIIGCAALYPLAETKTAEIACIAVHSDYRGGQRGDKLLDHLARSAQLQGVRQLVVLSTQTAHWFLERGFSKASLDALPECRKSLYNLQRNSNIFEKPLG